MYTVPCPHCSTQYARRHPRQRYCSDGCREAAKNARRRNAPEPKPCKACGNEFIATRTMKYCSLPCRKKINRQTEREKKQAAPKPPRKAHEPKSYPATCGLCQELYEARSPKSKYCGKKCSYESRAAANGKRDCRRCTTPLMDTHYARYCPACKILNKRESEANGKRLGRERGEAWATGKTHRARAKAYGVAYEPINRLHIYERDGWKCGICAEKIDRSLKHPHPLAVSLDHIIPISRGGGHVKENVQAAHWKCNINKGADAAYVQPLLIG